MVCGGGHRNEPHGSKVSKPRPPMKQGFSMFKFWWCEEGKFPSQSEEENMWKYFCMTMLLQLGADNNFPLRLHLQEK